MNEQLKVTRKIHFATSAKGRHKILPGPEPIRDLPTARIPRISRLMALAIHFDKMIQSGGLFDYAELSLLGHVSRARVTQIMNLLLLAPDIQEQILFLPPIARGHDPISERHLRPIVAKCDWSGQRAQWSNLCRKK
ncbi:hypothetical protein ACQ9LF_08815 [Anaerohalosphaeraceae bacterium U12dextr]